MKEGSAQVPGPRARRDRWILPGGKTGQTLNVRAKLLTRLESLPAVAQIITALQSLDLFL